MANSLNFCYQFSSTGFFDQATMAPEYTQGNHKYPLPLLPSELWIQIILNITEDGKIYRTYQEIPHNEQLKLRYRCYRLRTLNHSWNSLLVNIIERLSRLIDCVLQKKISYYYPAFFLYGLANKKMNWEEGFRWQEAEDKKIFTLNPPLISPATSCVVPLPEENIVCGSNLVGLWKRTETGDLLSIISPFCERHTLETGQSVDELIQLTHNIFATVGYDIEDEENLKASEEITSIKIWGFLPYCPPKKTTIISHCTLDIPPKFQDGYALIAEPHKEGVIKVFYIPLNEHSEKLELELHFNPDNKRIIKNLVIEDFSKDYIVLNWTGKMESQGYDIEYYKLEGNIFTICELSVEGDFFMLLDRSAILYHQHSIYAVNLENKSVDVLIEKIDKSFSIYTLDDFYFFVDVEFLYIYSIQQKNAEKFSLFDKTKDLVKSCSFFQVSRQLIILKVVFKKENSLNGELYQSMVKILCDGEGEWMKGSLKMCRSNFFNFSELFSDCNYLFALEKDNGLLSESDDVYEGHLECFSLKKEWVPFSSYSPYLIHHIKNSGAEKVVKRRKLDETELNP